jgi:hypothetical protein
VSPHAGLDRSADPSPDAGAEFVEIAAELGRRFAAGVDRSWPDFTAIALRVFGYQYRTNAVYRAFAAGRGRTPETVRRWQDVPAVPASAFKHLPLVSGPPEPVERVFRTSGTSGGGPTRLRGEHHVRSLALYRAASLPNLAANLGLDGGRIRILSLIPPASEQPASSLACMMSFAFDAFGAVGSASFAGLDATIDAEAFHRALLRAAADEVPVWVAGTAFAFVHWLDVARARGWHVRLPAGSRLMETGGFKGRSREVARPELYALLHAHLGIPVGRMVNEYGMTELLSQFYEPILYARDETGDADLGRRHHVGPPWVRTRVLDPTTLDACPAGEPGLLMHLDLANLGSVAAVLTADMGVAVEGGFRVLGRAPGAEPRGCSLALEELLDPAEPGDSGRARR